MILTVSESTDISTQRPRKNYFVQRQRSSETKYQQRSCRR